MFCRFPLKRLDLLREWEEFIQKQRGPDWHASRWSSLCSRHFREEDFRSFNERKTLKKSAVPTIMNSANSNNSNSKNSPSLVVNSHQNVDKAISSSPNTKSTTLTTNVPTEDISTVNTVSETPPIVYIESAGFQYVDNSKKVNGEDSPTYTSDTNQSPNEQECNNTFNELTEIPSIIHLSVPQEVVLDSSRIHNHLDVDASETNPSGAKSNCRLCGVNTTSANSFLTNNDLYEMIKKCFPTLNILREDFLPKSLCIICQRNLEQFVEFVNRVTDTQDELQRKYRARVAEKPVKIKQEPVSVFRVKQEVAEAFNEQEYTQTDIIGTSQDNQLFNNCNDEMSVGISDRNLENDKLASNSMVEQKYEFCDFPLMEDYDIMEIINLDDPFINIPDDDNTSCLKTTATDEQNTFFGPTDNHIMETTASQEKTEIPSQFPSAYDLLQVHLILEEHNYGKLRNNDNGESDFKQERPYCKIEATEMPEMLVQNVITLPHSHSYNSTMNSADEVKDTLIEQRMILNTPIESNVETILPSHIGRISPIQSTSTKETYITQQSTPLQFIPETANPVSILMENDVVNPEPIVTSISSFQHTSKSNGIVVLDESIVQSSSGCQLHTCMVCQLNFLNIEDLKQHYTQEHGTPMVCLPRINLDLIQYDNTHCKTENSKELERNIDTTSLQKPLSGLLPATLIPQQAVNQHESFNVNSIVNKENVFIDTNTINLDNDPNCNGNQYQNNNNIKISSARREKKLHVRRWSGRNKTINLNRIEIYFRQLKYLYRKLQTKCLHLQQNVEQLQQIPLQTSQPITVLNNRKNNNSELESRVYNEDTTLEVNSDITSRNDVIEINSKNPDKPSTFIQVNENHSFAAEVPSGFNSQPQSAQSSSERESSKKEHSNSKERKYQCEQCSKQFPSSSCLRQHRITHTNERRHQCELCERVFKRRNGLLQHLKSFHLQLKPFACPVCGYCYALKTDMKKCKHSSQKHSQKYTNKSKIQCSAEKEQHPPLVTVKETTTHNLNVNGNSDIS